MFSFKRIAYPFIMPALLLIASAIAVHYWPAMVVQRKHVKEIGAFLILFPLLPYVIFTTAALLGGRYKNGGLILVSLTLGLSYFLFNRYGPLRPQPLSMPLSILNAAVFLVPVNLALFSAMTKRRVMTFLFAGCLFLMASQVFALLLLCCWPEGTGAIGAGLIQKMTPAFAAPLANASARLGRLFNNDRLLIFVLCGAFLFLIQRFLRTRDTVQAGFAATLIAFWLAVFARMKFPAATVYFSAAGIFLIMTTIESSYVLAYVDELTGLSGRRSLNEALLNLSGQYAIAMIDVDHFKKFNDTYGHKTGDQVLKMIASHLGKIGGGAKTYRYGGEEFTALFSGKSIRDAQTHLEQYRRTIAATPFVVRGKQRRKATPNSRGKLKPGEQKQVTVTVSIGVAAPDKKNTPPEKVLKTADKLLYRAKKAGRNRVMA